MFFWGWGVLAKTAPGYWVLARRNFICSSPAKRCRLSLLRNEIGTNLHLKSFCVRNQNYINTWCLCEKRERHSRMVRSLQRGRARNSSGSNVPGEVALLRAGILFGSKGRTAISGRDRGLEVGSCYSSSLQQIPSVWVRTDSVGCRRGGIGSGRWHREIFDGGRRFPMPPYVDEFFAGDTSRSSLDRRQRFQGQWNPPIFYEELLSILNGRWRDGPV